MTPTIIFGLDGATFSVLDDMIAQGVMPRLQAFMAGGIRAELTSTVHPLTPPAWTTLVTGKSPGAHGIFDFLKHQWHPQGFLLSLNNFLSIRAETLWSHVSQSGGRVLSLNYPLAAPPPAINGTIVPGLLSWRHLRRNVHPPEAYQEFTALEGFNAQDLSWDLEHEKKALQSLPDDELESWAEFHIRRERQWIRLNEYCLERDHYDLAAIVFDGVDKLQHGCWRILDKSFAPSEPSPFETRLRKLCVDYFAQIDEALGRVIELAGPQARVFIVSDHGFGPSTRIFRINKWLEENGYLKWPESAGAGPQTSSQLFTPLDWDHTTAYVPSPASNGVYIRVKQHPADVGVSPQEYPAFRARLREQLLAIEDPIEGGPLLSDVLVREEAYPGVYSEDAPDLTIVMKDHGFVSILDASPSVAARPEVIGTHYPAGVLIAAGAGIRAGASLPPQSIVDIAPTLLYSLGLAVPADYEGTVIESLFTLDHLRAFPVGERLESRLEAAADEEVASAGQDAVAVGAAIDDPEGEEAIINQLRALGYLE